MTRAVPVTAYEDLTNRKRKPGLPAGLTAWAQMAAPRAVALYGYGRPQQGTLDAARELANAGVVHLVQKRGESGALLHLAIKAGRA